MKSAESIVLGMQREQQNHDILAHRDILNLDTQTRLKHMILHFLKYAGKFAVARQQHDSELLQHTLIDSFIICLATGNALNVSLAKKWGLTAADIDDLSCVIYRQRAGLDTSQIFDDALTKLSIIAGKMAKSIESTDHLERGNPRLELEDYIVELSEEMLVLIGALKINLGALIRHRWAAVEAKSIFSDRASIQ
ncbi:hypothetical protein [Massilia oculi]|uniref:hypothetical protein n=1 Tax=Massilia oculi TaxID=945844 RepID=UPI0028A71878|nr:hypothetical protein [Massilia oculi]